MTGVDRPIPIPESAQSSDDYHSVPIDSGDPRYHEDLVDVRDFAIAGENYYAKIDGSNPPYGRPVEGAVRELWCRRTIAAMLQGVNERIADRGVELFVWDAYRPIECQRAIWQFFWTRAQRDMPLAGEDALARQVGRYVSDPRPFDPGNPHTWPVHSTGAAIDLTLRDRKTGHLLDMGSHFDEMSDTSHTAHFEALLLAGRIDGTDIRLCNRRLLYWAMRNGGFTNYRYEYWHFDFGDQMYAAEMRRLAEPGTGAWYGYAHPPDRGPRT